MYCLLKSKHPRAQNSDRGCEAVILRTKCNKATKVTTHIYPLSLISKFGLFSSWFLFGPVQFPLICYQKEFSHLLTAGRQGLFQSLMFLPASNIFPSMSYSSSQCLENNKHIHVYVYIHLYIYIIYMYISYM